MYECMIIHIYMCAGTQKFPGWCLGAHLNYYE